MKIYNIVICARDHRTAVLLHNKLLAMCKVPANAFGARRFFLDENQPDVATQFVAAHGFKENDHLKGQQIKQFVHDSSMWGRNLALSEAKRFVGAHVCSLRI